LGKAGLAQPAGWFPFATYQALPHNMTTTPLDPFAGTISRPLTIKGYHHSGTVLTTNNGSNYWNIWLRSWGTGATISLINTSAWPVGGVGQSEDLGINYAITPGTDIGLYIRVYKTGSPGPLYLAGPAVFVT
jgi:hypothetical protein